MSLNLSEKQKKIVNHDEGAVLVKAGPGSGKTRVLIERIKVLLKKKKRNKILALTFSNLAAEEMKSRLEEDFSIQDLIINATVGTIHSFCLDLVQSRGTLIGLKGEMTLFENNADRKQILKDIFINDFELEKFLMSQEKPDKFLIECLSLISEQKKQFISPETCEIEAPFPTIYKAYNQQLIEQQSMDFDDILFFAYKILSQNERVANLYTSVYKYICIDEAQDLNFAQYEVIKALCGTEFKNVMMVGDENQSIYGFNGSDSSLMTTNFVSDFAPVTIYILNENYRSAKKIVVYANQLKDSENIANYVYDGELKGFIFHDEKAEAEFVAGRIKELLKTSHPDIDKKLLFDDFAVIARNKYVFHELESILQMERIPYFHKKTISGIDNESEYLNVFELCMRLLINSRDIVHLRELCKITKQKINSSLNNYSGINLLKRILLDEKYTSILHSIKFLDVDNFDFKKALKALKESINGIADEEKYLIFSDIEEWEKHWKKYASQVPKERRSLISFRNYISLGKTQDVSADNGIVLLTAHMSKGLQYEVVFVIGITEGTFPDYRATDKIALDQEKNNMYVAVTRAKRICYLTCLKYKKMPWGDIKSQRPSRFLNSITLEEM